MIANGLLGFSVLLALACIGLPATAAAQAPPPRPQLSAPQAAAPAQSAPPRSAPPARPAAVASGKPTGDVDGKGGEVIARVGSSDLTAEEVRATIASLDPRQQAALARDPALLSQTVRALLANRLVLREALAKKWDQQPKTVAQIERARENLIVETYLQSMTSPPESFPSEAEIKSVYEANPSAFLVPRRFRLAQIFIAQAKESDKAAEDEAQKKVNDLLKKLKQPGADFAAVAKSESDESESAGRGGEIGWVAESDLRPEIRGQIVALPKSAIAEPVRLDDGWHILKLLDTEASHTRPLAEVREALAARIRAERAEANRRAYLAELLKQSPPVINEIALSKLIEGAPGPATR